MHPRLNPLRYGADHHCPSQDPQGRSIESEPQSSRELAVTCRGGFLDRCLCQAGWQRGGAGGGWGVNGALVLLSVSLCYAPVVVGAVGYCEALEWSKDTEIIFRKVQVRVKYR